MKQIKIKILLTMCILFTAHLIWSETVSVGTYLMSTQEFPIYNRYHYSYTQQIYLHNEININGYISKLQFYYIPTGYISNPENWVIYMGNTSKDSFNSSEDWIPINNLTEVFSGDITSFLTSESGWIKIPLDTPFYYNTNANLVISIYENTKGKPSVSWGAFDCGSYRGIYHAANQNINPISPNLGQGIRGISNIINSLQLDIIAIMGMPVLISPINGENNVSLTPTLEWQAPSTDLMIGYKIYFGTSNPPTALIADINSTSYSIETPLNYSTTYFWSVTAYNSNGTEFQSPIWSFTTIILPSLNWINCRTTPDSNASIDLGWSYDVNNPPAYINIWALDYSEINGIETNPYPYYDSLNLIGDNIIINDIDPYTEGPSSLGWRKVARIPVTNSVTLDSSIWSEITRGYYYFTIYAEANNGQMSLAPKEPFYREALSYWLGDVYNNYGLINANDINYLSLTWGSRGKDLDLHIICDVGPTVDRGRCSRPMPDGQINIEDLMIFAMNYNNTNYSYYPRNISEIQPITITMNVLNTTEQITVDLVLGGNTGFVKGIDIPLAYGDGLQLLSVERGEIWSEDGLMLYTNENGVVTISGASLGADEIVEGNGTVATLVFSVTGNDTSLELRHMTARSCDNEEIEIVNNPTGSTDNDDAVNIIPVDSYMGKVYPNPFNPSTTLQYGLKEAGQVKISVFNARGQLIRSLVNESKAAGTYQIVWDGKDNNGHMASSGNYFFRMETKGGIKTTKGLMIK